MARSLLTQEEFEELPEESALRSEYRKTSEHPGYAYVLNAEAVDGLGLGNVETLTRTISKLRGDLRRAGSRSIPEDVELDAEGIRALVAERDELARKLERSKPNEDAERQVAEAVRSAQEPLQRDLEAATSREAALKERLFVELVDNQALQHLQQRDGPLEAYSPRALLPALRSKVRMVTEDGPDGKPAVRVVVPGEDVDARMVTKDGVTRQMGVADLLEELREKDADWRDAFKKNTLDGSGVRPGGGAGDLGDHPAENPFETGNRTEQFRLQQKNPGLAKRLEAEAKRNGQAARAR